MFFDYLVGVLASIWIPEIYSFLFPLINPMSLCCGGIPTAVLIVILFIILLRDEGLFSSTKRCPYCGEKILQETIWCKFCRRDLTERPLKEQYCSECESELRYIEEYDRWYCDRCRKYD